MRLFANPNVIDFSATSFKNQGIKRWKKSGFLMKAVDKDHDNTNSGIGEFLATASVKDLAAQKTAKWFNIW